MAESVSADETLLPDCISVGMEESTTVGALLDLAVVGLLLVILMDGGLVGILVRAASRDRIR